MNGLELYLLGRKLMKLGEQAIDPAAYFHQLPVSVRSVMLDVFEHPDSSVTEITARTGFPQSHVSASIAKLSAMDAVVTTVDPKDRRRTLVRQSPSVPSRAAHFTMSTVDEALAAALGEQDPAEVGEVVAFLQTLASRLNGTVSARGGAATSTLDTHSGK